MAKGKKQKGASHRLINDGGRESEKRKRERVKSVSSKRSVGLTHLTFYRI